MAYLWLAILLHFSRRSVVPKVTIKSAKKRAWDWFSKMVRLQECDDQGYCTCYTCGKRAFWKGGDMQAGHGIGSRRNSILFERDLVKSQCYRCNVPMGGNYDIFHAKLIKEYGMDTYDAWVLKKNKESVSWSIAELEEMIAEFKDEAKKIALDKGLVI